MVTLRSRFTYPANDLLTGNARLDLALDTASANLLHRERTLVASPPPESTIAVIGFPRSGNTTLTHWLQRFALPGIRVIDGRQRHSALELHYYARDGVPVLVPSRNPLDACASWMVRQGRGDDASFARRTLRAYTVWHQVARPALRLPSVTVAPFRVITDDPWTVAGWDRLNGLLDAETASAVHPDQFIEELRELLEAQDGQGAGAGDVPGWKMISLPDERRAPRLALARGHIQSPALHYEYAAARRAFERFTEDAATRGRYLAPLAVSVGVLTASSGALGAIQFLT